MVLVAGWVCRPPSWLCGARLGLCRLFEDVRAVDRGLSEKHLVVVASLWHPLGTAVDVVGRESAFARVRTAALLAISTVCG